MSKNWSDIFQKNIRTSETIADAVDQLMMILDDDHKIALATMQEEDLIDLHFSLGMAIRNTFGLHKSWSKLLASCGVIQLDDASRVIIRELWMRFV